MMGTRPSIHRLGCYDIVRLNEWYDLTGPTAGLPIFVA